MKLKNAIIIFSIYILLVILLCLKTLFDILLTMQPKMFRGLLNMCVTGIYDENFRISTVIYAEIRRIRDIYKFLTSGDESFLYGSDTNAHDKFDATAYSFMTLRKRSHVFIKSTPIYTDVIFNKLKNISNLLNVILFNLKWVLTALIISTIYFYISLFYIQVDIAKQIAIWYILFVLYYLLISTFNSFLIKYKYGKFTSAIQRFWKRTGIIFWLIEGFLFLLFFYYFLNSSQEPLYMFDYSSLNQELLIQLKATFKNLLLLSLAIYLSFILIFNLNYLNYFQNLFILLLTLLIIFYSLYIESYQFIYILSLYADKFWLFEDISQSWSLEIEENNLRAKQQYFIYCLIGKYWHFIFIFISWFFFFIKSIEIKKINYTMLGYNTQNLLILYVLNILCLIQWMKHLSKKFLEITYYWFHMQYDEELLNNFFFEIFNIICSLFNINSIIINIELIFILSDKILYPDSINLWKFI